MSRVVPGRQAPRRRVVLVDDHALFRAALRVILERDGDLEVVAEAATAPEALEAVERTHADLVLLDVHMTRGSGLDLLPALRRLGSRPRTLLVTASEEADLLARGLRLGARGVVLKHGGARTLSQAMHAVVAGEMWVDPRIARAVLQELSGPRAPAARSRAPAGALTRREQEIARLVAAGYTNQGVAALLGVRESTVKTHLTAVFRKLALPDRLALMRREDRRRR